MSSIVKEKLITWAQSCLYDEITSVEDIANTEYSHVLKIHTQNKSYYLKQTPPALYIEAGVLTILSDVCDLKNVPYLIAKNKDLYAFLMHDCGESTLRTLFGEVLDFTLLEKGMNSYIEIQKASSVHIQSFLDVGVPDWSISNLVTLYQSFIEDEKRLALWDLTDIEQARIQNSLSLFKSFHDALAKLNLPDVLNHCDFHPNAMVLDEEKSVIYIIDLGEVVIGHPLFPLASCLTNYLDHRWQIKKDREGYERINNYILQQWNIPAEQGTALIEMIGPLNYALSFWQLMKLSNYDGFSKWPNWIKPAFFDFLDLLEKRY